MSYTFNYVQLTAKLHKIYNDWCCKYKNNGNLITHIFRTQSTSLAFSISGCF